MEIRGKIIEHFLQNMSIRQISRYLIVAKSAVGRVIKQYKGTESVNWLCGKNLGRKFALDERDKRKRGIGERNTNESRWKSFRTERPVDATLS